MSVARQLPLVIAAACLLLLALVAAVVALMQFGAGEIADGGASMSFGDRVAAILMVSLFACALAGLALREFHSRYVRACARLAEETGALAAHGGVRVGGPAGAAEGSLSGAGLGDYLAPEVRALAIAVNRLASVRDSLARDVEARVRESRASLEEERSRLAALMSELKQSVIVCTLDGRVLLYNQRASEELSEQSLVAGELGESSEFGAYGKSSLLGLGRSIYTVFDRSLIAHALERLQPVSASASGERQGGVAADGAHFVTATRGGRLLRAQLSPVLAADAQLGGFVLILDDITADHERDARRDALIQSLTEGARGPLGNIRAAAEMLADFSDIGDEQRARFLAVIRDEARTLSQHLEGAASAFSNDLRRRWPLEEMLGAELLAAAVRRIGERGPLSCRVDSVDEGIWLCIDSYGLLQALGYLAARLADEYQVREVLLALSSSGSLAQLDLMWSGTSMSNEAAMSWEMDAMNTGGEATPLSVRDVVDRCNGEIWFSRHRVTHRSFFRILLPLAPAPRDSDRSRELARRGSRPEFYDFDLFARPAANPQLDDCALSDLTYTVFDTETTGLDPSGGDEIIQIGATRIVNRRLLGQECFDQLVDPQRPLADESIAIHGITPGLLAGQPTIASVLPAFRAFCDDTVLVAHNAAFDMRFLQLKEDALGLRFDQPLLDTLLLSAVLHPAQESHRLEAIAERLGVSVVGRHTALGDAMVTAEVFLKMLPLLDAMGIHTLAQAREASEKTFHARIKY
jgi:DNA polymerase-3 subunit epsilon